MPTARKITLIATGLNLIWDKHVVDILLARARSGEAEITICMGNPYSPHVEDRLIEEDMEDRPAPVGREGIFLNIKSLLRHARAAGNPMQLKIRLFENYPTFAILIFDDQIFFYPYAYEELGNVSPIFHLQDDGSDEARFFLASAARIVRDSVPAEDIVAVREDTRYFSPEWLAVAVFLIPDADDPFYQLGSSILGYDIRGCAAIAHSRSDAPLNLSSFVGEAREYGLHVTLADALYFSTPAQLHRLKAELQMLARDFPPFTFTNPVLRSDFRDMPEIVLAVSDMTGVVEALHHECVSRIYRAAVSSRYRAGKTQKRARMEDERSRLMMVRYGSPYILNRFTPHFTLSSASPQDEETRLALMNYLETHLGRSVRHGIDINELCLVALRAGGNEWEIVERIPLNPRVRF
jgi:hypothetical protein